MACQWEKRQFNDGLYGTYAQMCVLTDSQSATTTRMGVDAALEGLLAVCLQSAGFVPIQHPHDSAQFFEVDWVHLPVV